MLQVLEGCGLVACCENKGFWRKRRKWRVCILHTKTRVLVLRTPKTTKMAGVTPESGVFTTPKVTRIWGQNRTCRETWVDAAPDLVPTFCVGCFWNRLLQVSQVCLIHRERKVSPKLSRPKFCCWHPRGASVSQCWVFPGLGKPDQRFSPYVCKDIRPKTSSLGRFLLPELSNQEQGVFRRGFCKNVRFLFAVALWVRNVLLPWVFVCLPGRDTGFCKDTLD